MSSIDTVCVFDIGGTKTEIALLGYAGNMLERHKIEPTPQNPTEAFTQFGQVLDQFFRDYSIDVIVAGAPGLIINGSKSGYFLQRPSNLPQWGNLNLRGKIDYIVGTTLRQIPGSRYPSLIITESDANVGVAGASIAKITEMQNRGSLNGPFDLMYVTISSGFGGSEARIDGTQFIIYRKADGGNFELGHEKFSGRAPNMGDINCEHCPYPNCLETWIGGTHMMARYGRTPDNSTPEMRNMVADNSGKALSQFKLPAQPSLVILGGRIPNSWDQEGFTSLVGQYANHYYAQLGMEPPKVELSALGCDVSIIGGWGIAIKAWTGEWPNYDLSRLRASAKTYQPSVTALSHY